MTQHHLDPKNDLVFKCLFGKPKYELSLIRFLTAVLKPASPIERAWVVNPLLATDLPSDKGSVLDLRVELSGGAQVDVEMQLSVNTDLPGRFVYYWGRMFVAQLQRGGEYSTLKPCISVLVLGENLLPTARFHTKFHIAVDDDHYRFSDHLEFHILELPKLEAADMADELAGWGRFFVADTDEERWEVGMTYPGVRGAVENLEELSRDEEFRQRALQRELDWATERIRLGSAYHHGREEGELLALRESVRTLARVFGITLGLEQEAALSRMAAAELRGVHEHLAKERRFP